jgi:UDP-N-acetyl-D-glucosamine dehydrogenase
MLYRAREKGVVERRYVGLPLAVAFAEVGVRVVGIEKDSERLAVLDTYDSYVEDVPAERLQPLVASGKLQFTGDCRALKGAGAVVICLPTPLNEHRDPDLSMFSGAREVARNLRVGALVALESITYPGDDAGGTPSHY